MRSGRLSSVTVCHFFLLYGFNREDQEEVLFMVMDTPVADWVPSTPADMGESTDSLSVPLMFLLVSSGGGAGAIPTCL